MKKHPHAAILQRVIDGEDLKGRIWFLNKESSEWVECICYSVLLSNSDWTFAISDEPGVPPPLPRPMIQLRKDGPTYYRGETVAPGDDGTGVWIAITPKANVYNGCPWLSWSKWLRESALRLGLVHLSEDNYKLHMAALEDLMIWAHEGGAK